MGTENKLKVLWICNIMLPVIAKELGLPYSNREGWLSGIFQQLLDEKEQKMQLGVCFPVEQMPEMLAGKGNKAFLVKGVPCYAFCENLRTPEVYVSIPSWENSATACTFTGSSSSSHRI